jgi:hypothetical protein
MLPGLNDIPKNSHKKAVLKLAQFGVMEYSVLDRSFERLRRGGHPSCGPLETLWEIEARVFLFWTVFCFSRVRNPNPLPQFETSLPQPRVAGGIWEPREAQGALRVMGQSAICVASLAPWTGSGPLIAIRKMSP